MGTIILVPCYLTALWRKNKPVRKYWPHISKHLLVSRLRPAYTSDGGITCLARMAGLAPGHSAPSSLLRWEGSWTHDAGWPPWWVWGQQLGPQGNRTHKYEGRQHLGARKGLLRNWRKARLLLQRVVSELIRRRPSGSSRRGPARPQLSSAPCQPTLLAGTAKCCSVPN